MSVDVTIEIQDRIKSFREEQDLHVASAEESERRLYEFLLEVHKQRLASVEKIAKWLSVSRQTVYNNWEKFGLKGESNRENQTSRAT